MFVRDGMQPLDTTVASQDTLHQASARMAADGVSAALVDDPQSHGPGVLTEHDVFTVVSQGLDPRNERVADHMNADFLVGDPDWTLEKAANLMVREGRPYLVVRAGGGIVGIVRMRDIVRCWTSGGVANEDEPVGGSEYDRRRAQLESITGF